MKIRPDFRLDMYTKKLWAEWKDELIFQNGGRRRWKYYAILIFKVHAKGGSKISSAIYEHWSGDLKKAIPAFYFSLILPDFLSLMVSGFHNMKQDVFLTIPYIDN